MNPSLLHKILSIPTETGREDKMVEFLVAYGCALSSGMTVLVDKFNNVLLKKGHAAYYPCVSAHIDSVQPVSREFEVVERNGLYTAIDLDGKPVGFGGDDKAGVYVCLELLNRFDNIAVALFASEESGAVGARNAPDYFFSDVGYVLEFDCPAFGLVSYSSGGINLFQNDGDFIKACLPTMQAENMCWQRHPYSDVSVLRSRFQLSCLNLSCGYYNWHRKDECVKVSDVAKAVEVGTRLVTALGCKKYACRDSVMSESAPLMPVTGLSVPELV